MDDLTEKRLEKDKEKFAGITRNMMSTMDRMTSDVGGLEALTAEMSRRMPEWASSLLAFPNVAVGFVASRLQVLGAPAGYWLELLTAALDIEAPRVWPQHGTSAPDWVIEPGPPCDCGAEHPAGARSLAGQVIRTLLFAYSEISQIVGEDAILRGDLKPTLKDATSDEMERESKLIRERTIEIMSFMITLLASCIPEM